MSDFPRRIFPCNECPWRRDAQPGQFSACRYDALASTSGAPGAEAPPSAPMFGCHKGEPGTNADLACAGWLAVAGENHLGIRIAVAQRRLPVEALTPGAGWPDLYGSYEEMAAANQGSAVLDPTIAWLEDQARAHDEARQSPHRHLLPDVPTYLAHPGAEPLPPRPDNPDELRAHLEEARAAAEVTSHG
ncbi:DUF6283 family protein [Streptosporangium sp. V21-05]|uniref:DUF6283 family protein n=1 Tax=Streptosporangium sp. V21-05 TaxID=3446115 RepID=UPI003F530B73